MHIPTSETSRDYFVVDMKNAASVFGSLIVRYKVNANEKRQNLILEVSDVVHMNAAVLFPYSFVVLLIICSLFSIPFFHHRVLFLPEQ